MAIQLLLCGVLPPGLVQHCSQHSCVVAVKLFLHTFNERPCSASIQLYQHGYVTLYYSKGLKLAVSVRDRDEGQRLTEDCYNTFLNYVVSLYSEPYVFAYLTRGSQPEVCLHPLGPVCRIS